MTTQAPHAGREPLFAHASEAEMARILDFYEVRWEYEPQAFPILWNLDGDVVESFAPDFWLPDLDLYLEMTTLKQRLVRRKNRKLRRVRELYPDLRVKLFYARDFRALMLKYGKLALAAGLSGTLGQVPPAGATVPEPGPDGPGGRSDATRATGPLEVPATPDVAAPSEAPVSPAAPAPVGGTPRVGERRTARRRRARRRTAEHVGPIVPATRGGA